MALVQLLLCLSSVAIHTFNNVEFMTRKCFSALSIDGRVWGGRECGERGFIGFDELWKRIGVDVETENPSSFLECLQYRPREAKHDEREIEDAEVFGVSILW